MRYTVFADIHSNLPAWQAFLEDLKDKGVESYICLGDIVGYGGKPNECVQAVRELGGVVLGGNHDHVAAGMEEPDGFSGIARESVLKTREMLTDESRELLKSTERVYLDEAAGMYCNHSSPGDARPGEWNYVDEDILFMFFPRFEQRLCFVGHRHVPELFTQVGEEMSRQRFEPGFPFLAGQADKAIVNVGAVGQPRDGDPRGSYVIYDSQEGSVELFRFEYSLREAVEDIKSAGLPDRNWQRLLGGD